MENLIKYETITTRIMEARTFTVLIEQDEDGLFVAKVPDIPGCYTQGKTVQEALERIKEAIQVCLESEGQELTPLKFVGLQQVEVADYA